MILKRSNIQFYISRTTFCLWLNGSSQSQVDEIVQMLQKGCDYEGIRQTMHRNKERVKALFDPNYRWKE
jgi:phosphoribosyl-AMP cyclohydrolase